MKVFRDKNGTPIKAGDTLRRVFYARWRERPGHKRVAFDGMSGNDVIVADEGDLLERKKHWVTYKVKWSGACLVADRLAYSDFQALCGAELFDEAGYKIFEGSAFHYLNANFKSKVYEII